MDTTDREISIECGSALVILTPSERLVIRAVAPPTPGAAAAVLPPPNLGGPIIASRSTVFAVDRTQLDALADLDDLPARASNDLGIDVLLEPDVE